MDADLSDSQREAPLEPSCSGQTLVAILSEELGLLRWRLTPLMGLVAFGSFYNLDVPGAIGMGDGETIQGRFISVHGGGGGGDISTEEIYTNAMNQQLYSTFYYPGIVVPLFSGILLDRIIGPRNAVIVFCSLMVLGSLLFALGVSAANYHLMLTGRFTSGIASETTMILRSYFVSRFFKRGSNIRGVALAFGVAIASSRAGALSTFPVSVWIANTLGVAMACYAGFFCATFSLVCGLVLNHFDGVAEEYGLVPPQAHLIAKAKEREAKEHRQALSKLTRSLSIQSCMQSPSVQDSQLHIQTTLKRAQLSSADFTDVSNVDTPSGRTSRSQSVSCESSPKKGMGILRRMSSLRQVESEPSSPVCRERQVQKALVVADGLTSTLPAQTTKCGSQVRDDGGACAISNSDSGNSLSTSQTTTADPLVAGWSKFVTLVTTQVSLGMLSQLPLHYWSLCLGVAAFFPAVFAFFSFAKPFLEAKWSLSESEAVFAVSCYQFASVLGCPVFGCLLDSVGRNSVALVIGSSGALLMHILLVSTSSIPPAVVLFVFGLCHGMFVGAFMPTMALVVDGALLGLGYGVIGSLECSGIALAPVIIGALLDAATTAEEGSQHTHTSVGGYIKGEAVLILSLIVSASSCACFLVMDLKYLQGVVFAKPAERVELFRLKDAAQADADGREKEEMEQRIREAADALMAAFHDANGSWEPEHEAQVGDNYHSPPNSPVAVTAKMDREDQRLYDADIPLPA